MNDQQNPYDPYGQQPQIIGYDAYGQPVYQQPQQPQQYDPYAQQGQPLPEQGYGYDPYSQQQQRHQQGEEPQQYDPYTGSPVSQQPPTPSDQGQNQNNGQGGQGGQGYGYGYGFTGAPGYDSGSGYGQESGYAQGTGYAPAAGVDDRSGFDTPPGHETAQGHDGGRRSGAVDTDQQWNIPQQQPSARRAAGSGAAAPAESVPVHTPETEAAWAEGPGAFDGPEGARGAGEAGGTVPGPRRPEGERDERDYRTEQFSFIEEPDEDSEDVIDWLKFTESRSERREEAKRRGRNRVVALVAVLALALVGGVGYLWSAGELPGLSESGSKSGAAATGTQKRDVIVVHLHNTKKKGTSTALLVDNVTTGRGTTVLLPNALSVANDDGTTTTLGKSVDDDGSEGTRQAVGTLLGAKVTGTWRLDTPFLENLVELVGTIDLTTDTAVPGAKAGAAPLVKQGENQTLNGRAAVAYATHLGPAETEAKQLQRFGQVMQAVLKKIPSDAGSATVTVETLGQILDPSLTEKDLGASLAQLSEYAKGGDYTTTLLPVQQDGSLTEQASSGVVKNILGGSVSAPEKGAAVRVGIRNATGEAAATETARVSLVNGGYAVVDSGAADTADASSVTYGDDARKAEAAEVAKTLGLPTDAVKKAATAPNADISVVIGQDFKAER